MSCYICFGNDRVASLDEDVLDAVMLVKVPPL